MGEKGRTKNRAKANVMSVLCGLKERGGRQNRRPCTTWKKVLDVRTQTSRHGEGSHNVNFPDEGGCLRYKIASWDQGCGADVRAIKRVGVWDLDMRPACHRLVPLHQTGMTCKGRGVIDKMTGQQAVHRRGSLFYPAEPDDDVGLGRGQPWSAALAGSSGATASGRRRGLMARGKLLMGRHCRWLKQPDSCDVQGSTCAAKSVAVLDGARWLG